MPTNKKVPLPVRLGKAAMNVSLIVYLAICTACTTMQRQMLYHPEAGAISPETSDLKHFRDVRLTAGDGVKTDAWYHAASGGYPTIVFFHGNGGNLAGCAGELSAFAEAGFGVLGLDYRGYGISGGHPSEEGFYADARAAVQYALQSLKLPPGDLILYGESIGTGVAVQMATEFPLGALVLQSPYSSIETQAKLRYPYLPVHWLLADKFDSLSKIPRVHMPLLLMHGALDRVIAIEDGKLLFQAANEPKRAVYFPDAGHNDLPIRGRVEALYDFARVQHLVKE